MANKVKVAIFDFCGTCVNFQTADAYIDYATKDFIDAKTLQKSEAKRKRLLKLRIIQLHDRFFKSSLNKRIIAQRIKGMKYEDADKRAINYIKDKIEPALIKETIDLFKEYKSSGAYTLFISAAYDIYLSKFVQKYGFDGMVSTKLISKNGVMLGKIKDDCVGKRKAKEAIKYLDNKFGKGNYEIVFSIGDSKTDIPILELAQRKVVISTKHQDWVKENYEEIIYVH